MRHLLRVFGGGGEERDHEPPLGISEPHSPGSHPWVSGTVLPSWGLALLAPQVRNSLVVASPREQPCGEEMTGASSATIERRRRLRAWLHAELRA
jgi:hypothetical protein